MFTYKHSRFLRQIVIVFLSGVLLFQTACGSTAANSQAQSESAITSTLPVTSEDASVTSNEGKDSAVDTTEQKRTTETTEDSGSSPDSTTSENDASASKTTEAQTNATSSAADTPENSTGSSAAADPEDTAAPVNGPHVSEGPVKNMLRQGLIWVSRSMGYSMEDRTGAGGHFDCSGLVAVLLRDGLGETSIGWFGNDPWDTAYWRYFASQYAEGNRVQIGNAVFEVHFRESYDFSHAWEVPGSIVVQYPPENDPSVKSGHISLALGTIPYETTEDVIRYLREEYGIELTGITGNNGNIPMVYDPNGVGSGHVTWKINANGVALATCVDNNYSNDPSWIERISAVFVPVTD